ncbi:MAG: hypothetical protein NVSMB1_07080 [Polyangiales bacterium]
MVLRMATTTANAIASVKRFTRIPGMIAETNSTLTPLSRKRTIKRTSSGIGLIGP